MWLLGFAAGFALGAYLFATAIESRAQSVPELIDEAAAYYGLPDWARRRAHDVCWCESRYQPDAYNRSSGATGPFQFIPSTARAVGIDPWNPRQNVYAAIRLMSQGHWRHWRACL